MVPRAANVSITKAGKGEPLGLLDQSVYTNQQAPRKQGNAEHSKRHCFQKQGKWLLRRGFYSVKTHACTPVCTHVHLPIQLKCKTYSLIQILLILK